MSLFTTTPHKKQLAMSYCLGVCVLMLPTLIDGFGNASLLEHFSFVQRGYGYSAAMDGHYDLVYWFHHIIHGLHVSILFAGCVLGTLYYKQYRWALILVSLLCVIDLVFFIYGRMALLSLFLSITLIGLFHFHSKKHIAFFISLMVLVMATANTSLPTVKARLLLIQSETSSAYAEEDLSVSDGERMHMWALSWRMFKEAPIFGKGSFYIPYYLKTSHDPLMDRGHLSAHSEYLTQLSLYGITGFILFMSLLGITFKNARAIEDKWLADFTTIGLAIFCFNALVNSSLFDFWPGFTFVLFASIVAASPLKEDKILH